jgi:MFS family permease
MYDVEDSQAVAKGHRALFRSSLRAGVGRTVILLGVVSLLTDISSEMVSTVLPLYLVYSVGLSPLQFGVVDGIYQGGAALVRVASGFVADRTRRHKEVALAGYGLSALCRPLLIVFGSAWGALAAVVFLDRTGKGIRTAPRDALISLSTTPERLGTAFGIHRALDTTGAMLGPLLAFGLLVLVPQGFDSVFVVSFVFAILGVAMLALFVRNPTSAASEQPPKPKVSLAAAARLMGRGSFARLVLATSLVALFTISDGFIYLALQQRVDFDTGFFPLLYVATALVYMLLAVPMGVLGDRVGRVRVFLGGCLALLAVYGVLLTDLDGLGMVGMALALFGLYYAATDGVLAAIASALLPGDLRATGLAAVTTVSGLSRLVASIAFGALWTTSDVHTAIVVYAVGLAAVLPVVAILVLRRRPEEARA